MLKKIFILLIALLMSVPVWADIMIGVKKEGVVTEADVKPDTAKPKVIQEIDDPEYISLMEYFNEELKREGVLMNGDDLYKIVPYVQFKKIEESCFVDDNPPRPSIIIKTKFLGIKDALPRFDALLAPAPIWYGSSCRDIRIFEFIEEFLENNNRLTRYEVARYLNEVFFHDIRRVFPAGYVCETAGYRQFVCKELPPLENGKRRARISGLSSEMIEPLREIFRKYHGRESEFGAGFIEFDLNKMEKNEKK